MKKAIISVMSILLVSVMMATMMSGCVPYTALGSYDFNAGATNPFGKSSNESAYVVVWREEDDFSRYKLSISVSLWYNPLLWDYFTADSYFIGPASSDTFTLYNEDNSLSVSGKIYTTNRTILGEPGSKAKIEVNGYVWNVVTIDTY